MNAWKANIQIYNIKALYSSVYICGCETLQTLYKLCYFICNFDSNLSLYDLISCDYFHCSQWQFWFWLCNPQSGGLSQHQVGHGAVKGGCRQAAPLLRLQRCGLHVHLLLSHLVVLNVIYSIFHVKISTGGDWNFFLVFLVRNWTTLNYLPDNTRWKLRRTYYYQIVVKNNLLIINFTFIFLLFN